MRGDWAAGRVDIEEIFDTPDFIDGSNCGAPHWDAYAQAERDCAEAPSCDASDASSD